MNGTRDASLFYCDVLVFNLRPEEVQGYKAFLQNSDWQMGYGALIEGNHIDACFGKNSSAAAGAKQYLKTLTEEGSKKKAISAYSTLFNIVGSYQSDLNASW